MGMANSGQLLSLIAGRQKAAARRPDVPPVKPRGAVKTAQYANPYAEQYRRQFAERDRDDAAAGRARAQPRATHTSSGFLGGDRLTPSVPSNGGAYAGYGDQNADFDRANAIATRHGEGSGDPNFNEASSRAKAVGAGDVVADDERAQARRAFEQYAYSQGAKRPMSYDEVRKQVDAEVAADERELGAALDDRSHPRHLAALLRERARRRGLAAAQAGGGTAWRDLDEDIHTNSVLRENAVGYGLGQTARFLYKWLNPGNWGSSTQARINRMNIDADMETASRLYHERQMRVMRNFNDKTLDLSDPRNNGGLGMANFAANSAVGEFAGGELATAGVGGVARGISNGIVGVGAKAGARVGAAAAKMTRPVVGARVGGWAGGAANRMTTGVAKTVASPFTLGGYMAAPVTASGKAVGAAGRAAWDTGKAAVRPAGDLLHYLRHPVQNTRQAWQYAAQHPFRAAGRTAMYPVRYGWNVAKPGLTLGKNLVFSPHAMYGQAAYDAYSNARAGAYGSAAGSVAGMGALDALGPWALPGYFAYGMLGGGE